MTNRLLPLLFLLLLSSAVRAHDHPVEDLLELPHPIQVLLQGDFSNRLDAKQKEQVDRLRREIQPRFMGLMNSALPIQESLRKSVADHNHHDTIDEAELKRLAELRIQMSRVMAGAYERLKNILDAETWQALQDELAKKH